MNRASIMLAGRTAVITGAASGIGRALALEAAENGMAVAACDRDGAGLVDLNRTLRSLGTSVMTEVLDVTDAAALRAFASAIGILPPVSLLFANAGILRRESVLTMPIEQWRQMIDVNVLGVVATLQTFVPVMQAQCDRTQVIVTGSTGSMTVPPGLAAYAATKHALWPIVEALREELADTAVGVSLLMPGAVATHIFDAIDPDRAQPVDAISPQDAARFAFAGAMIDRPKILTHPRYIAQVKHRFDNVIGQLGE